MTKYTPFSYFDVIDACAEPGCPLCRMSQKVVERHLAGIIYDSVNDPEIRLTLRQSYGYCHTHAWLLPGIESSSPLGIAFIYRDLLNTVTKDLDNGRFQKRSRLSLKSMKQKLDRKQPASNTENMVKQVQPSKPCPACVEQIEMDRLAVLAMTEALDESNENMITALAESDGICLPHLRQSLELCHSEISFTTLVTQAKEKFLALQSELDEFIRKHDYRFQKEKIGAEKDSWRRAIATMVGQPRHKK